MKCTNSPAKNMGFVQWQNVSYATLTYLPLVPNIWVSESSQHWFRSDKGLSPIRRRAIICTNVGFLSIRPLGTSFSEILIKIQTFSFTKMHLKILSAKRRPFCLLGVGVNWQHVCDIEPGKWMQIPKPNVELYRWYYKYCVDCLGPW